MLARTFRQMLVILEKNVRDSRAIWQALWQGFRMPPFAADDLIRQARRFKSRRGLTRALRLIARADLELRSSPPDKRLVLERLVYELASEPKPASDLRHPISFPSRGNPADSSGRARRIAWNDDLLIRDNPRLCRGGSRSLTFAGISPGLCFYLLLVKMLERREA
jgi:hypothetical protein